MKDAPIQPLAKINPEDEKLSALLQRVAAHTQPAAYFQSDLERRLKAAYKPNRADFKSSMRTLAPTLAWILALIALALILDWAIRSLVPQPRPAIGEPATPSAPAPQATPRLPENNSRPTPAGSSYSWNGTTLTLQASLPGSPEVADVYRLQPDRHASLAEAVDLARRFGINGEAYLSTGELPGSSDYVVTDGRQWMFIRSIHYFTYFADYPNSEALQGNEASLPDAAARIDAFLISHGFDFEYKLDSTDMWGKYYVTPLTPDGFAVRHEDLRPSGLLIILDGSGQVASVQANLVDYDMVGTYGIRTAEAAWNSLLANTGQAGMLEWMYSPSGPDHTWLRSYPLGQTLTIYCHVSSYPSAEDGKAPLIQVGRYSATGNLAGLDQLAQDTFIAASGQFETTDGITRFNLASWKASSLTEDGILGNLEKVDGQVVLAAQEGNFQLVDPPADLPLPFEHAFAIGVRLGSTFDWTTIDNRGTGGGGGGGGGGGQGFYKINLSGTPVPLPTPMPTPLPPEQKPAGQPIEGQLGLFFVTHYKELNGGLRSEYALLSKNGTGQFPYMLLEGDLEPLLANHNRPVKIWGSVDHYDANGTPVVKVERYEVPYPGLKFQVLRGTQTIVQLEGQAATLFTSEDGKTYVQEMPSGDVDQSQVGRPGDAVLIEALAIPDETYAGYPAARVFNAQMAINPKTGQPNELVIGADQPIITNEPSAPAVSNPPTASIEKVELVYFVSNPRDQTDPESGYLYLQPAWRFYGHYSSGEEFEVLIQALQDEYLLPELAPFIPPG